MTRDEIFADYKVCDGRICSPGKFEGEPIYTPHFWCMTLDGMADEDEEGMAVFILTAEDMQTFPELVADGYSVGDRLAFYEDDNGFVYACCDAND